MFEPQNKEVQETQLSCEPSKLVYKNKATNKEQKYTAEDFNGMEIFPDALVELEKAANAQRRK